MFIKLCAKLSSSESLKEAVASKSQVENIISDALEGLSEDIADYYEVEVRDEGSMQREPGMGFIPNYDAGHNYSALVPLSYLWGTGKGVPNVIQPFVDSAIEDAEKEFADDPDSEEIQDYLDTGDGYVNFDIYGIYYDEDNSRVDENTIVLVIEANEKDVASVEFTFTDTVDLENKIDSAVSELESKYEDSFKGEVNELFDDEDFWKSEKAKEQEKYGKEDGEEDHVEESLEPNENLNNLMRGKKVEEVMSTPDYFIIKLDDGTQIAFDTIRAAKLSPEQIDNLNEDDKKISLVNILKETGLVNEQKSGDSYEELASMIEKFPLHYTELPDDLLESLISDIEMSGMAKDHYEVSSFLYEEISKYLTKLDLEKSYAEDEEEGHFTLLGSDFFDEIGLSYGSDHYDYFDSSQSLDFKLTDQQASDVMKKTEEPIKENKLSLINILKNT